MHAIIKYELKVYVKNIIKLCKTIDYKRNYSQCKLGVMFVLEYYS